MRLIIKAHKYVKRWRGPSGKYHYKYAREAEYKGKPVIDRPIYLNIGGKKMLVPQERILAAFEKFGAMWIITPEYNHIKQKINPNRLQAVEINSGLRADIFDTDSPQEAIKQGIAALDKIGNERTQQAIMRAKPVAQLPEHSKDIRLYAEKPPGLDEMGKITLAKKINAKLDNIFHDESVIRSWMNEVYSASELPELWGNIKDSDDYILETAIKDKIGLREAGDYVEGFVALQQIANDHNLGWGIDQVEDWISEVDMKEDLQEYGEKHLADFGYSDSVLGSISYGSVIARAMEEGVHPNAIESNLDYEAAKIRSEEEEDKAVVDYGEVTYDLNYDPTKAVFYDLTPEKAEKALKSGSASGGKLLGGGCNGSFRIQVSDGDPVEAVFKPYKGERHDLKEAVPDNFYVREAAAYELDKMLGIDLVPPTIIMDIDGDVGSAQYFVKARDGALTSWRSEVPVNQLTKAALLDYLIFNLDRHENNLMVDADNNLILIDNGLGFPNREAGAGYRTPFINVISGEHETVPPKIYKRMEDIMLKENVEQKFLSMGMDQKSIDGLVERWNKVLESGKVDGEI